MFVEVGDMTFYTTTFALVKKHAYVTDLIVPIILLMLAIVDGGYESKPIFNPYLSLISMAKLTHSLQGCC